jgi:hypothetical protein
VIGQQQSFGDVIAAEEDAVAEGAPGCGVVDPGCHGGLTCVRRQHAEDAPHVGKDAAGALVQWMPPCPPPTTGGTP